MKYRQALDFRSKNILKVQMERWDGSVLDNNATCPDFGHKCSKLPGMLTLNHCDTTAYPYGKGNATALNII